MMRASAQQIQPFKKNLPALLFIAYVFLMIFLCRVVFSPLMPSIQAEMDFSHSQAGRLFFFLALGSSMGLISNGFISRALIHRRTIALALLLSGLALIITSQSRGYSSLAVSMVVTGWASGLYLPSGVTTITSIAHARNWGKALAVHDIAPNLSFFLAPLIAEGVLYFASWRETLILLGLIQILSAGVYHVFGRGGASFGRVPNLKTVAFIVKQPAFWILAGFFGVAIGMGLGLYSMIPLYLISEHEFQRETANQLLAISRVFGLLGTLASGYFTDRLGTKWTLGLYFVCGSAAATLLGLSKGLLLVIAVCIQPAVATLFFPAGLTALSAAFEEKFRSVAVSLVIPVATIIGQGLVPTMIGFLGQQGAFYLGFVIMGGILLTGLLPLPFSRFLQQAGKVQSGVDSL
jgi:NNP family nitrate/nitrite transporter-like MFS transporter